MQKSYGFGAALLLLACAGNGDGGASGNGGSSGSTAGTGGIGGAGGGGACDMLGSKCHGVDGDLAKECHELGHNGDEAKCQEKIADCLKVCVAGSGGSGGIAGSGGVGGSAGTAGQAGSSGAGGSAGSTGGMGGSATGGTAGMSGGGGEGGSSGQGGVAGTAGSAGSSGEGGSSGGQGGTSGAGGMTGGMGGSGGGGSQECQDYCTCMQDTCSDQTGYPFVDAASCVAACEGYTPEELTCWSKWCEDAKTASSKMHLCEHAWGAFELDEC